jgi:hypothetical protein
VSPMGSTPKNFTHTVRCVAYCCPQCESVLSVESDPVIRDKEIQDLERELADLKKLVEQTLRKLAAKGLS